MYDRIARGRQLGQTQIFQLHARQVHGQRNREERHRRRHQHPWPRARPHPRQESRLLPHRRHESRNCIGPRCRQTARRMARTCRCQNPLKQPLGRLRLRRQKLQPLAALARRFVHLRASRATGLVRHKPRFLLGLQQPVQSIRQLRFPLAASRRPRNVCALCHGYITSFLLRSNSRASSARPRLMRDFTVPSGISKTCAISL